MKSIKLKINDNLYDVNIIGVKGNIAEVSVNGTVYMVEIEGQKLNLPNLVSASKIETVQSVPEKPAPVPEEMKPQISPRLEDPVQLKANYKVKSPLPGIILGIQVKPGDKVTHGQKLITLEAMKMENSINSEKAGIITAIKVIKGDSVLEGDVLLEMSTS
jgi:biotin carboxyl carrier protein